MTLDLPLTLILNSSLRRRLPDYSRRDKGDARRAPGAEVTFKRGGVRVQLRRAGRLSARPGVAMVDGLAYAGPETVDASPCTAIEKAMYALGETDAQRTAPRACFFCTHSDYEPSTGFGGGHLACFVADADRYHQIATSAQPRERKWGMWREYLRYLSRRKNLAKGMMQPGCVVVPNVLGQHPAQVVLVDDQQLVKELKAVAWEILSHDLPHTAGTDLR